MSLTMQSSCQFNGTINFHNTFYPQTQNYQYQNYPGMQPLCNVPSLVPPTCAHTTYSPFYNRNPLFAPWQVAPSAAPINSTPRPPPPIPSSSSRLRTPLSRVTPPKSFANVNHYPYWYSPPRSPPRVPSYNSFSSLSLYHSQASSSPDSFNPRPSFSPQSLLSSPSVLENHSLKRPTFPSPNQRQINLGLPSVHPKPSSSASARNPSTNSSNLGIRSQPSSSTGSPFDTRSVASASSSSETQKAYEKSIAKVTEASDRLQEALRRVQKDLENGKKRKKVGADIKKINRFMEPRENHRNLKAEKGHLGSSFWGKMWPNDTQGKSILDTLPPRPSSGFDSESSYYRITSPETSPKKLPKSMSPYIPKSPSSQPRTAKYESMPLQDLYEVATQNSVRASVNPLLSPLHKLAGIAPLGLYRQKTLAKHDTNDVPWRVVKAFARIGHRENPEVAAMEALAASVGLSVPAGHVTPPTANSSRKTSLTVLSSPSLASVSDDCPSAPTVRTATTTPTPEISRNPLRLGRDVVPFSDISSPLTFQSPSSFLFSPLARREAEERNRIAGDEQMRRVRMKEAEKERKKEEEADKEREQLVRKVVELEMRVVVSELQVASLGGAVDLFEEIEREVVEGAVEKALDIFAARKVFEKRVLEKKKKVVA